MTEHIPIILIAAIRASGNGTWLQIPAYQTSLDFLPLFQERYDLVLTQGQCDFLFPSLDKPGMISVVWMPSPAMTRPTPASNF
jgi:hypothetical protein